MVTSTEPGALDGTANRIEDLLFERFRRSRVVQIERKEKTRFDR
jgi:hypothetical protein